jgi:molybdenum cofactor biosynthesis enzyme
MAHVGLTTCAIRLPILILVTVQRQFVQVLRAVELAIGVPSSMSTGVNINAAMNVTVAMSTIADGKSIDPEISSVLRDAIPVLIRMVNQYSDFRTFFQPTQKNRDPLTTKCISCLLCLSFD